VAAEIAGEYFSSSFSLRRRILADFRGFMAPGQPQADIANPWSPIDSARCLDLCFLTMVRGETSLGKAHSTSAAEKQIIIYIY
jgi:hypothetical protein